MTFQDALTAMQAGHRVRRAEWTRVKYMILDGGDFLGRALPADDYSRIAVKGTDKQIYLAMALRTVDLLATDWELVEP